MAQDLVLHYQGVNRLLGSPARLNRALAVAAGVLLIATAGRLLTGNAGLGDLAVYVAAVSAIAILVLGYSRLRFANAGLFLANGRVGVIGTLGGRTGSTSRKSITFSAARCRQRTRGPIESSSSSSAAVVRCFACPRLT